MGALTWLTVKMGLMVARRGPARPDWTATLDADNWAEVTVPTLPYFLEI